MSQNPRSRRVRRVYGFVLIPGTQFDAAMSGSMAALEGASVLHEALGEILRLDPYRSARAAIRIARAARRAADERLERP